MPNFNIDEGKLSQLSGLAGEGINQTAPTDLGLSGGRVDESLGLESQDQGLGIASQQEPEVGAQEKQFREIFGNLPEDHPIRTGVNRGVGDTFVNYGAIRKNKIDAYTKLKQERRAAFEAKISQGIKIAKLASNLPPDRQKAYLDSITDDVEAEMPGGMTEIREMVSDPKLLAEYVEDSLRFPDDPEKLTTAIMEQNPDGKNAAKLLGEIYKQGVASKNKKKSDAKVPRATKFNAKQVDDQASKNVASLGPKFKGSKPDELSPLGNALKAELVRKTQARMTSRDNPVGFDEAYKGAFEEIKASDRLTAKGKTTDPGALARFFLNSEPTPFTDVDYKIEPELRLDKQAADGDFSTGKDEVVKTSNKNKKKETKKPVETLEAFKARLKKKNPDYKDADLEKYYNANIKSK